MNNSGNSGRKKANTTPWKPASTAIAQDQQDLDLDTDSAQANIATAFPEYCYTPSSSFPAHVMIATNDMSELKIPLKKALEGLITRFSSKAWCWKVLVETGGLFRT